MAHGGTNFGFYNGANTGANEADYKPDLTSYDYVRNLLTHLLHLTFIVCCGMHSYELGYLLSRMHQLGKLEM